ncbi:MAG: transcriptional regulator [Parvibaculum sp.]
MFQKKKIEVVVEAVYLNRVIDAAVKAGAKGYSVIPHLTGNGQHGVRQGRGLSGAFENAMFISIVDKAIADDVVKNIHAAIGEAIGILYMSDVDVIRSEHF